MVVMEYPADQIRLKAVPEPHRITAPRTDVYDPDWWRALPEEEQGSALVQRILDRKAYERGMNTLIYGTSTPGPVEQAMASLWDHYAGTAVAQAQRRIDKLRDVAARGLEKAGAYTAPDISPALIRWPQHARGPQEFKPEWAWPEAFGPFAEQGREFMSTLLHIERAIEERCRNED